jgi:hypothetical protein
MKYFAAFIVMAMLLSGGMSVMTHLSYAYADGGGD